MTPQDAIASTVHALEAFATARRVLEHVALEHEDIVEVTELVEEVSGALFLAGLIDAEVLIERLAALHERLVALETVECACVTRP